MVDHEALGEGVRAQGEGERMDRSNKDEKKEKVLRDPFEWFASEQERLEALRRFDQLLRTLKDWDEKLKWEEDIPPETLN